MVPWAPGICCAWAEHYLWQPSLSGEWTRQHATQLILFLGVLDWCWTYKLTRHAHCIGWRPL